MSQKKTIAVDVDNVLADSTPGLVEFSNQKWGTNLTIDDYDEDWAKMWQVNHSEAKLRAQTFYDSGIWGSFPHVEEAKPILERLSNDYKLIITTSRVQYIQRDTIEWLNTHYTRLFEEIHLSGIYDSEHANPAKLTKAQLCRFVGADYLIDDQPKHCFSVAELGITGLLFGEYSWSRNIGHIPKNVTRVYSWGAVEGFFYGKHN